MYTLKSIVRRGTALGAAVAVFAAAIVPTAPVFADALNPLTERSLLLSSSAPGWQNTDGSGNSETNLNANGEYYTPPGSGPNGMKTGETFSFNVSTDSSGAGPAIKAFTLQYCTKAAGLCKSPGNNDDKSNADALADGDQTSDLDVAGTWTEGAGAGQFQVLVNGVANTGWTMTTSNEEDNAYTPDVGETGLTGKMNYITLVNGASTAKPAPGQNVRIVFRPSTTNYITNPGSGAFFVKINTYNSETDQINPNNDPTPLVTDDQTVIDGGVTVANVMTDSIHITTKVLETMAFSVGTRNPDTQAVPHGSCDAIQVVNNNRLNLGNQNAEYSLETDRAYDVASYWRLSSNSSGGATVYYSGNTLQNTVGDFIKPIGAAPGNGEDGAKDYSHPGTEQFGLALVDPSDTTATGSGDALDGGTFPSNHVTPTTSPLVVESDYADGDLPSISNATTTSNAQFAFKKSSNTVPALIAQENSQVISCATSKVRYVANIAADTPAGVYTTKINFLAAPQY